MFLIQGIKWGQTDIPNFTKINPQPSKPEKGHNEIYIQWTPHFKLVLFENNKSNTFFVSAMLKTRLMEKLYDSEELGRKQIQIKRGPL